MLKLLTHIENQPFSDNEILTLVDGKSNLVIYPDIERYSNIDELLGRHECCIILYVTKDTKKLTSGHWTCLFKIDNKTLEFFDPYGNAPDTQLSKCIHKIPLLTDLIMRSQYNIVYNKSKLQSINNHNSSTCGRHCGMRIQLRDIPIQTYSKLLTSIKGLLPDQLVTLMTAFLK
jgi:hypothetical protein